MKFFHLSDLHIGKHLFYYSLLEDQKYVFHQILEAAKEEQPDAVLLCGDIYDKTIPSAEAVSLFDWFLTELKETLPKALILRYDKPKRSIVTSVRFIRWQRATHL